MIDYTQHIYEHQQHLSTRRYKNKKMNIPITNPQINLDLNDKSNIDESIK